MLLSERDDALFGDDFGGGGEESGGGQEQWLSDVHAPEPDQGQSPYFGGAKASKGRGG